MRVLVMGSKGSTGKRYCTILKSLCADVVEYDIQHFRNNRRIPKEEMAIVATPTHLHYSHTKKLLELGYKKILIEKPLSKNIDEINDLISLSGDAELSVVCNWSFAAMGKLRPGEHDITYNYYNHGMDQEPIWDLCQLLYLSDSNMLDFSCTSPFFTVLIDGFVISLEAIEKSYFHMLVNWAVTPKHLWNLEDAKKMSLKCLDYLDP